MLSQQLTGSVKSEFLANLLLEKQDHKITQLDCQLGYRFSLMSNTDFNAYVHYSTNKHQETLRNNKLIIPKAISVKGVKIDLAKIHQSIYMLSIGDDYIALWQATWQGIKHTAAKTIKAAIILDGFVLLRQHTLEYAER